MTLFVVCGRSLQQGVLSNVKYWLDRAGECKEVLRESVMVDWAEFSVHTAVWSSQHGG